MVIMPKLTDKETEIRRKEICDSCEKSKLGVCTKCGCVLKLKVKFEQNTCPLNKW
jgi:hypothetical protein